MARLLEQAIAGAKEPRLLVRLQVQLQVAASDVQAVVEASKELRQAQASVAERRMAKQVLVEAAQTAAAALMPFRQSHQMSAAAQATVAA